MSHRITTRARPLTLAGPALFALALVLSGCASTGVTTASVLEVNGALEDAARYRQAKQDSDRIMLENLSGSLHKVGDLTARYALEVASKDDEPLRADIGAVAAALEALTAEGKPLAAVDAAKIAVGLRAAANKRGALDKAEAEKVIRELSTELKAAHKLLMDMRESQIGNEVHYESMRSIIVAAVGLLSALAEREQSEQKLNAAGQKLVAAGADASRKMGVAAATGGLTP